MMTRMKESLSRAGVKPEKKTAYPVSDGYALTKLPVYRLQSRMDVARYDVDAPCLRGTLDVSSVAIPLKMHIGSPAEAVVSVGSRVKKGDLIAKIPEGKMGANIHASIDGTVASIENGAICIKR